MKHHLTLLFALAMTLMLTGCLLEDDDSVTYEAQRTLEQSLDAPETSSGDPTLDPDDPDAIGADSRGCFRVVKSIRMYCNPCGSRSCRIRIRERDNGSDY